MSTFPDQIIALIPCTILYPNSQRIIDNLGTLVRMRCAEIKAARKKAQTKDRKASMVLVVTRERDGTGWMSLIQRKKDEEKSVVDVLLP